MSTTSDPNNFRKLLEQQYLKSQKLQAKLKKLEEERTEPIAIVGMGCRFPGGGSDPEAFWQALKAGVDGIREVSPHRWPADPVLQRQSETRWAGLLDDVSGFDASFFGISPREAMSLDPQQRLLLEVAWEALEHAGRAPDRLMGSATGVFVGISALDYQRQATARNASQLDAYSTTGNLMSVAAGRLSYVLGLQGPCLAIDTACSSSLVAVHMACQSLRSGACEMALAGGVNVLLSPLAMYLVAQTQGLSPDGRCKTFDASANGFVRAEGCGLVVLKRLSDARRDGDRVLALVRGSAVNHDGRSTGLTVPNVLSQQALLRQALKDAGVSSSQISYVETHGTGTSLGDPIEVEALKEVLGQPRKDGSTCALGSVKTNLGHLESAAGVAGLIKVVLSLAHETIPRHLHFRTLNPRISLDETCFAIPREEMPWKAGAAPRLAGVSGFGVSGTNAHLIVEEAPPPPEATAEVDRPLHVLALSAQSPEALRDQAARYAQHLSAHPEQALGDVCHTAGTGRTHFAHRLAVVARSPSDLQKDLQSFAAGEPRPACIRGSREAGAGRPKVAFLFTGQGSQYAGMGRSLGQTQTVFRDALARCDAVLRPLLDRPLLSLLHPSDGETSPIDQTGYTQPALFALEYALFELWRSWGVEPDIVLGHSVGECVAACVAGVFSLEEGLKLIAERGRRMQALPLDGAMASVRADASRVARAIEPHAATVTIAALNGPESVVISGERQAVQRACAALNAEGIETKALQVSHAFHSPLMDPMLGDFERAISDVAFSAPRIPVVSNLSGKVAGAEMLAPAYWRDHVRQPVRFADGMAALRAHGCEVLVEIGPHPTLLGMGAACWPDGAGVWLPSLRKGREDWEVLLESVARLYAAGGNVDWAGLDRPYPRRRVPLPTYPFQRQRYWLEPVRSGASEWSSGAGGHPLLGQALGLSTRPGIQFWQAELGPEAVPYLADHKVQDAVILPAAAYLEMALAAAQATFAPAACALEDVVLREALAFPAGETLTVQVVVTDEAADLASFHVSSRRSGEPTSATSAWTLHASGRIRLNGGQELESPASPEAPEAIQARCGATASGESYYEELAELGFAYGPSFQGVQELWRGDGEALGRLRLTEEVSEQGAFYRLHPALLDAGLQVVVAALGGAAGDPVVPVGVRRFRIHRPPGAEVWSHVRVRPRGDEKRDPLEGDVLLLDGAGRLLVEISGLRLKRLEPTSRRGDDDHPFLALRWQAAELPAQAPAPHREPGRWLLFGDGGGVADAVQPLLEAQGDAVVRVAGGDALKPEAHDALLGRASGDGVPCRGVIYLWGLDTPPAEERPPASLVDDMGHAYGGLLHLAQALARTGWRDTPRIWVVTRGVQAIGPGAPEVAVAQAPLWGLARTIASEHPEQPCTRVDLGKERFRGDAEALVREVLSAGPEEEIALRPEGRHVARLDRCAVPEAAPAEHGMLRPDASYLITGGLGGLGLSVARWMVAQGARHLALLGRRGAATAEQAEAVAALEAVGAQVLVASVDVSERESLASVLEDIARRMPPLRGVVHAAAVLDDGLLAQQDMARFRRVMAPKAAGAWNLHQLTRGADLDFFVLYSSAASLLGSPGQGNYTAANAFLDALAQHRRSLGLPGLSIAWGPFSEVGLAAAQDNRGARLSSRGMRSLTPEEGTAILGRLIGGGPAQVGVISLDMRQWIEFFPQAASSPRLSPLVQSAGRAAGPKGRGSALRKALLAVTPAERPEVLHQWIRDQVAQVLRLDPGQIDQQVPFNSLGFDSLMGLELRNRLESGLGLSLPSTLIWTYPHLAALAAFLESKIEGLLQQEEVAKKRAPAPRLAVATIEHRETSKTEPIAIVGLGCRFPGGGTDPEAFWQLLKDGVDAIREVPEDRWSVRDVPTEQPGARWGGFLDSVDGFDPAFFGITPREATDLDPQHRLILEVSWEALEHAGFAPDRLNGSRTGVYVGIMNHDYQHQVQARDWRRLDAYSATGNGVCFAAGRLSYVLGLQGPCLSVDTACSSSLVAVHLASQALRGRECDLALAGGVNLVLSPLVMHLVAQTQGLSPDGRCKAFDASANGFVRSEGCGFVVLKRLSDARRDGDRIWAVVRGSAVNQDGRSTGLTTPNVLSQQALIRQALEDAGVSPSQIGYVEAHGTGTSLGDPIEAAALAEVLGQPRPDGSRCALGSVKTNLGHLESAAGVAGLIKVVLSLAHETIPRHLHFKALNPRISLNGTPLFISKDEIPWRAGTSRRIAGISSFGLSGTNAHLIVEEAPPPPEATAEVDRPLHVLPLSAQSPEALRDQAVRYSRHLSAHPEQALGDVCHTAGTGRTHFAHRLAVVARSPADLRKELQSFAAGEPRPACIRGSREARAGRPKVAFLFTGQGSQYAGMGRSLSQTQPAFRDALARCDAVLRPLLDRPLLSLLHPPDGEPSPIDQTGYTQPALFALEYALFELWKSWGVEPDIVLGHSVGECVAACVAGAFSLEDGLKLIAERGRRMQALPLDGAMASVRADASRVARAIEPHAATVTIAALNGPESVVISGERQAVQRACAALNAEGVQTKPLQVSHAFHSPLMDPMLGDFERAISDVAFSAPRIPVVSNLSGKVAGAEMLAPAYWRDHVRQPVRFADGIAALRAHGCEVLVEIGPHPTLLGLAAACWPDGSGLWLPSLRKGREDWEVLLESVARLYAAGGHVDWAGFDRPYPRRRVPLPTYPFQRQRYWANGASQPRAADAPTATASRTAVLQHLEQGDVGALSSQLEAAGQLSPDELKLMPRVLESLVEQHRRQALSSSVEGFIHEMVWRALPPTRESAGSGPDGSGAWLIFADRGGLGQALSRRLEERGATCVLVQAGTAWETTTEGRSWTIDPRIPEHFDRLLREAPGPDGKSLRRIVHLWSLDAPSVEATTSSGLEQAHLVGCGAAIHLLQALGRAALLDSSRLWLVTRGAVPAQASTPLEVAQAPLWGLGLVMSTEHPELGVRLLDLDPARAEGEAERLADDLRGPVVDEPWVALRNGRRHAPRLVRGRLPERPAMPLRPDGSYLITGGMGALGLAVARWMVERGARHLVLTGRRGAAGRATEEALEGLRRSGADVRGVRADVSKPDDVARVLSELEATMPPLAGIIHAAGVLEDGVLLGQGLDAFSRVMAPKVAGAWNLHVATRQRSLDFFVFFSSAAAMLGPPGQGSYAAANTFLDALAHHRRALGLPAVSINWGAWGGTGMAAELDERSRLRLAKRGVGTITPEQGLAVLERSLHGGPAQVGVLSVDWERWMGEAGRSHPALKELLPEVASPVAPRADEAPDVLQKLAAATRQERRQILQEHVQAQVAQVIGLQRAAALDPERGFAEMGMDSLMALELKNRVQATLNKALSSTAIFNYPNVALLSSHILDLLQLPESQASRPPSPPPAQPPPREQDRPGKEPRDIDGLSDEELAQIISAKFSKT
jgi:acyl transferase domain-containing protein/acyl carrier protein